MDQRRTSKRKVCFGNTDEVTRSKAALANTKPVTRGKAGHSNTEQVTRNKLALANTKPVTRGKAGHSNTKQVARNKLAFGNTKQVTRGKVALLNDDTGLTEALNRGDILAVKSVLEMKNFNLSSQCLNVALLRAVTRDKKQIVQLLLRRLKTLSQRHVALLEKYSLLVVKDRWG